MKTLNLIRINISIIVAVILLCGCTQLSALNNTITKTNVAMNMPSMTETQNQTMHANLLKKVNDNAIAQARVEAKPTLENILTISACYSKFDINKYLTAYSVAGKQDYVTPMFMMQYHPKSQCLTVTRLDNWKMAAKNAFSFRAIFVSDASSESRSIFYEMIKQPDGMWLLH